MFFFLYFRTEVITVLPPIFFNEKPVDALASLANEDKAWYASLLAKEIDCTYPHMVNILDKFKENDLIETEKEGRVKRINLTPQGEDLAMDLQNIKRRMERISEGNEEEEPDLEEGDES